MSKPNFLPVTVDKSHLITIGERLYTESIELIRELVNNAYDADATEVRVTLSDDVVRVEDNGAGMDFDGLRQYFNIGSPEKLQKPKSPRFRRDRIGQFGIGKFASLSACERFEVETQKGSFAARVIFDKSTWEQAGEAWHLPLEYREPDSQRGDGTTVTLLRLTRRFDPKEVERRLVEGVPLKAPSFQVFLNGERVRPRTLSGHRIPVLEGTAYGPVFGEILVLPASASDPGPPGIEVKVKQVTVRRDLFGAEGWGRAAERLRGELHADFLPVTTDRSGFVQDSPEYLAFLETVGRVMNEVRAILRQLTGQRERRAASKALREALERIHRALIRNPDLSPFGPLPEAGAGGQGRGAAVSGTGTGKPREEVVGGSEVAPSKRKRTVRKPKVKRLTPDAVVKRLRVGHEGVSCCLDHFGEDGPECFSEGIVIYINRDHPLYRREARKAETHTMHLARLLTQEITLMKDAPRDPRKAFDRQSKLLRDAFAENKE
ncbi:MAG: ATP-binding protein [Candidatus Methylomirabilales bacterium]